MLKFLILLSIAVCAFGAAAVPKELPTQLDEGIVEAPITNIFSYPFMVSVLKSGDYMCTGTVVGPRHVLTSANCIADGSPSDYRVRFASLLTILGLTNTVKSLHIQAPDSVGLLKLNYNLLFSLLTQPLPLADEDPGLGAEVTVAGWGSSSNPGNPQLVFSTTVHNSMCNHIPNINPAVHGCINLAGANPCVGNPGGPVIANGQVGGVVVNWAIPCARGFNDAYDRVSHFRLWILAQMGG